MSGQGAYIPPDKPRLVIGIVVEQLKYDQLEKFRDRLGENGIKRLINEGTYFKNASFEYMLTQSAPGHATISTGQNLHFMELHLITGICHLRMNLFTVQRILMLILSEEVLNRVFILLLIFRLQHFLMNLRWQQIRKQKFLESVLKENSAILSAGHAADGAYWFDNTTGTWMTSTYYIDSLPAWVNDFNAMKLF